MSKVLFTLAGTALVAILGVQQYQLASIAGDVAEIKQAIAPQADTQLVAFNRSEEHCLAKNVYYEAGVESLQGKYAIAQVTLNRLQSGRWGNSICKVVYARKQFSWTINKNPAKPSGKAWEDSQAVARHVMQGKRVAPLKQAMYYHADYVKPTWREPVAKIKQVGRHIFYTRAKIKHTVRDV